MHLGGRFRAAVPRRVEWRARDSGGRRRASVHWLRGARHGNQRGTMSMAGVGHFLSWDGGCLLMGTSVGIVPLHAHYAIQITVGSESGVRFRTSEREEWTEYHGVIIPSRQ